MIPSGLGAPPPRDPPGGAEELGCGEGCLEHRAQPAASASRSKVADLAYEGLRSGVRAIDGWISMH